MPASKSTGLRVLPVALACLVLLGFDASAQGVCGDINGDGAVDALDVQLVINAVLGLDTGFDCDVNGDTNSDALDVQLTVNAALGLVSGVTVPDTVGMSQSAAESAIAEAGLAVGVVSEAYSATVPLGSVISQDPTAGSSALPGSPVDLVVSKGPQPVGVPDVVGMTQANAEAAISAAGLTVGVVTQAYSATVPSGSVISQDPVAESSALPGSGVDLVVSKGPQPVGVPDVVGMTQANAEAAITTLGLTVGTVTQEYSDTVAEGQVISQNPAAGTEVAQGTAVDLVVSLGPEGQPQEAFFALPKTGPVPLQVTFDLSDPLKATEVTSWAWDFENDGTVDSTDPEPAHRYETPGDFTVGLSITTAKGTETFTLPACVQARERVETVVHDNVIIVENEPDLAYVSKTATTLVLEYTGSEPLPIEVGDIVIGTAEDGYARLVKSIEQSGTTLTLTTENAPLTSIFENADISCPVQFTPEDMRKAGFQVDKGGAPRLPLDNIELTAGVLLNGSVEFEPRLDWDCRLDPLYLRTAFVGTLAVNLQADLGVEGAIHTNNEFSILPQKLWRLDWVQVGWVPVIIYSEFDIKAGVELGLEGKTSVAAGYSSATTVRFGAEYLDGAFRPISGLSLNTERFGPEFYFEAGGYAKVFVRPEGKVRIYGILGPGASLEPYVKAELQWVPTRELTLKAGLETELSFSIVDLEPIGLNFNAGLSTTINYPVIVLGHWPLGGAGNKPATPAFTASPLTGTAPLAVQFTDASKPGSGTIIEWDWDFGDGTLTGTQQPQHTYANPGTYRVALRVKGTSGQADWAATEVIHVLPAQTPPTALFTATPTRGTAPLTVQFTDRSNPGSAPITEWVWDLDGDGIVDRFAQNPTWTYASPGAYSITLLVTTADGNDAFTATNFIVASGPPGQTETVMLPGNVPLVMVWIPAGTFMMGRYPGEQDSYDWEDPQHPVTLAHGFWLGKYELTKRQWTAVMGTTPWSGLSYVLNDLDSPAVYVSWDDARAFITALNSYAGQTFRLPSEAEWEYACRAGTSTRFYWGDDPSYSQIASYAWYWGNCSGEMYAHVVGLKLPNARGLYDMSGNVWEWCEDDWHDRYTGAPTDGRAWVDSPRGSYRVLRGGCWYSYGGGYFCRSAYRLNYPSYAYGSIGFRLSR